ncbi:MAG: tyrosinase family protein [Gammaproteobacteria bacterium]|nr:tyrosinase family protein [Gammaproteobacteria bacterium]
MTFLHWSIASTEGDGAMSLTRRSVLIAGLSSALMAGRINAKQSATALRIRHNVASEAGKRMLEKYARAVSRMTQLSEIAEQDARSWTYQWYIHAVPPERNGFPAGKPRELNRVFGTGSSPAKTLANELWTTCQAHLPQSDPHMFLPWHRMYLLAFEEIVRSVLADADFTLPYWDYTTPGNRALPVQFRTMNDPKFGSLYRENRQQASTSRHQRRR